MLGNPVTHHPFLKIIYSGSSKSLNLEIAHFYVGNLQSETKRNSEIIHLSSSAGSGFIEEQP